MKNIEARNKADDVQRLLDYAATADIAGDPLVIDLVAALSQATSDLNEIENIMQRFREGASSGESLLEIDDVLNGSA